jgi:phosphate transport system substrate-binding protein
MPPSHQCAACRSGTSFIFTNYLSKVNPDWKPKSVKATAVNWPVMPVAGNEGVSQGRLPTRSAAVEYAYVKQNKMTFAQLRNSAGTYVSWTTPASAAAAGADWAKSSTRSDRAAR